MKLMNVLIMVLLSATQFSCVHEADDTADIGAVATDAITTDGIVTDAVNINTAPKEVHTIASSQNEQLTANLTMEAQQKIGVFSSTLKQALVGAIKSGGLIHAVDVCQSQAPAIAQSVSVDGWQVRRTSLRTRNSANVADNWELDTLAQFDNKYKTGEKASELNAFIQNDEQFRYMQAIETQQVCLACHGQKVDAGLLEAINQRYPNDLATGFTLEELRGAFTLTKTL